MSIYDDARTAINAIDQANTAMTAKIAGHSDLASLNTMVSDTAAMTDTVNKAEAAAIAAAAPMPLVKGLLEEGMGQYLPSVKNVTCSPHWADLQPTSFGPIADNNAIDKFLASGKPGRVRVYMGRYSPAWVIALGKVHMYDPTDGNDADCPRWWEPKVQQAQADFITKLAAKYDGKISLIFMANGSTIYAEPFIRGIADSRTRANLLAAGYTPDKDKASYEAGFQMHTAFKKTRIGLAFNPWQYVKPDGSGATDVTFSIAMMDRMRAVFGERAVWQNNSIRYGGLGPLYQAMYDHMKGHKPISFQCAIDSRIGDWAKTLQWAVDQGAHAVELSPNFQNRLTAAQLQQFDAALRAN